MTLVPGSAFLLEQLKGLVGVRAYDNPRTSYCPCYHLCNVLVSYVGNAWSQITPGRAEGTFSNRYIDIDRQKEGCAGGQRRRRRRRRASLHVYVTGLSPGLAEAGMTTALLKKQAGHSYNPC